MSIPSDSQQLTARGDKEPNSGDREEYIDFREIFGRLLRGAYQTLGLALIALVIADLVCLFAIRFSPTSTSTRVVFSFPGSGKGLYPDGSKFSASDLSAPDVVREALKQTNLDTEISSESQIRAALAIEGIFPADLVKLRDRMIASGITPPPYSPDEYLVVLTLPRSVNLSKHQRELLVGAIVDAYRDKFRRAYASVPVEFGNLQQTLKSADYDDYERILNLEIQAINSFLRQISTDAPSFRSQTTNFSFNDLSMECQMFDQLYVHETLGIIRLSSLSRDRRTALLKMDYELQNLTDQAHQASEEEQTTRDLLTQAANHTGSYVLGIKSQIAQSSGGNAPLDQGLLDSLVANDPYNFMIRKTLDASLLVKRIESERSRIAQSRKDMEAAINGRLFNDKELVARAEDSMRKLDVAYDQLIANIRNTYSDYSRQQYADSIRFSGGIQTDGLVGPLLKAGLIGTFLGAATGVGLSLLGIYVGKQI